MMNVGLLVLRIAVGLLFAGHGAQKLLGWFGGHGLAGTARFFESLGMRPARLHALLAGLAELGGGSLLALGLLTPAAAMVLTAVMTTAIITVHYRNGPWASDGGYEYNLVLVAAVFALAGAGAGRYSLDHALSLHVAGWKWAVGELVIGLLGGAVTVLSRNLRAPRREGRARPTPAV
ncbi:MAG: DoxX family protein [Acidobacteriota bacterium]|nr:DoxX family protein [Acidobacteriota bacterium]